MIKLKPLLERISTKPFDDKSGRNHLVSNYENAFEEWMSGNILYRGHSTKNSYEEVYPSQGERQSIDAPNIYTVLLSRLPSWKGWPQRSHSLIFSNSHEVSSEFGSKMVYVFPNKDANIVVSPGCDVFSKTSFPFLNKHTDLTVNELGILIDILTLLDDRKVDSWENIRRFKSNLYHLKKNDYDVFIHTIQSIITQNKMFKLCKHIIKKSESGKILNTDEKLIFKFGRGYINTYKTHNGNWEMFLDFLLNPETNGFKLVPFFKLGKLKLNVNNGNEMWTDSNCMLVDIKETEILKELGKAVFA